MTQRGRGCWPLVVLLFWGLAGSAQADCAETHVLLLLPLEENSAQQSLFGQAFLDGVIDGDQQPIEGDFCEIELHYLNTQDETTTFMAQWYRALEQQPDLLIGPLLPAYQAQLNGLNQIELPESTRWLYPGDASRLSVAQPEQVITFSLGWRESLRNLLEYGWDQGQHDLALLLPDSDLGRAISDATVLNWEGRGGSIAAVAYYGERFSDLNRAMRQLIQQSRGAFDLLLTQSDDQRLRMLRPLMNFHSREEPIYSLTPPVGELGLRKDLKEIYYPMQPALLERHYPNFEVDDFLLQVESVGFDLVMMLRTGGWEDLLKKGSYLGRSGRYTIEEQRLLRTLCMVVSEGNRPVVQWCPQEERSSEQEL